MIHPTAIVDSKAEIDENVQIGPYSIISDNVSIGSGTVIGPHVIVDRFVSIGPECQIFQFASVGAEPQAVKFKGEKTFVKIEHDSDIFCGCGILSGLQKFKITTG